MYCWLFTLIYFERTQESFLKYPFKVLYQFDASVDATHIQEINFIFPFLKKKLNFQQSCNLICR